MGFGDASGMQATRHIFGDSCGGVMAKRETSSGDAGRDHTTARAAAGSAYRTVRECVTVVWPCRKNRPLLEGNTRKIERLERIQYEQQRLIEDLKKQCASCEPHEGV